MGRTAGMLQDDIQQEIIIEPVIVVHELVT